MMTRSRRQGIKLGVIRLDRALSGLGLGVWGLGLRGLDRVFWFRVKLEGLRASPHWLGFRDLPYPQPEPPRT